MAKPRVIYLDAKATQMLDNPDTLSCDVGAFRNGGTSNGVAALPFVELTPDLLAVLQSRVCGRQWGGGDVTHTCDRELFHDGQCSWPGR